MMARFEGASDAFGFSTRFRMRKRRSWLPLWATGSASTTPYAEMFSTRHFHQREHGRAEVLVYVQQLTHTRDLGVDHVVGQHDSERLVTDEFFGAQDGVAQAQRFFLPNVRDIDHVGYAAYRCSMSFLPRDSSRCSSSKLTSK